MIQGVLDTFDGFEKIIRDQFDDKERRFKLMAELVNLKHSDDYIKFQQRFSN